MFRSLLLLVLALCASASVSAQDAPAASEPVAASQPAAGAAPAEDFKSLDQEVQALKKEVLDLNRELFVLEEDLLFPANTQVAVFVSMDVGEFFALALDAVHRLEGTINQFLGDGFMALFGAPIAREDHTRRAILAALQLRATVANALGERAYLFRRAAPMSDEGLLMTPRRTDTDGFYVAVMRRND